MAVGVNEASKTKGVAWVTGHIALRKNLSPEALEKFRRSQRRAINPGGPMHFELPSPIAYLLAFQKLIFPTGAGLEPARLVQTVREFELYMIELTFKAADYNLLQGQEHANFSVTIDRESLLEETAKPSNASPIYDDPNNSEGTYDGKGGQ